MRRRSYARHFSSAVLLELSFNSLSFQRTLLPAHRSNSREQFTPREALMASWSSAHQRVAAGQQSSARWLRAQSALLHRRRNRPLFGARAHRTH